MLQEAKENKLDFGNVTALVWKFETGNAKEDAEDIKMHDIIRKMNMDRIAVASW